MITPPIAPYLPLFFFLPLHPLCRVCRRWLASRECSVRTCTGGMRQLRHNPYGGSDHGFFLSLSLGFIFPSGDRSRINFPAAQFMHSHRFFRICASINKMCVWENDLYLQRDIFSSQAALGALQRCLTRWWTSSSRGTWIPPSWTER